MKKQICFRIDEKIFKQLKIKLKKESKSLTLFLQNLIEKYIEKS